MTFNLFFSLRQAQTDTIGHKLFLNQPQFLYKDY
jgi:hypothetical protein